MQGPRGRGEITVNGCRRFRRFSFIGCKSGSSVGARVEIIVTFLVVLELPKRRAIKVEQAGVFGDIAIQPSDEPPAPEMIDERLMDEEEQG